MDSEHWQRVQGIVNEAFDLAPEKQHPFIAKACAGDEALLQEVRQLLAADSAASAVFGQLAEPIDDVPPLTVAEGAKQLANYRFVRRIGAGGMGVIYQAIDIRLERPVAIKFLSPDLLAGGEGRQRFFNEARAVSRLDHPNICTIYDIGEAAGHQPYFTMPCYDGESLEARIQNGGLTTGRASKYGVQIAAGLRYAHEHDILHRDIKPANIYITRDDTVKILDFGIAKISGQELTMIGALIGTVAYMSPEQAQGRSVDARSDIWSLGVLIYRLFTGRLPFEADTQFALGNEIVGGSYRPLRTQMTDVPEELERVIARSINTDLEARYASMGEMLSALRRLQGELERNGMADRELTATPASNAAAESTVRSTRQLALTDEQLRQITSALAESAGPVAGVLVKRSRKNTTSVAELCRLLSEHIKNTVERDAFLIKVRHLM